MKIAWIGSVSESSVLRSASFSRAVLPLLAGTHSIEVFVSEPEELRGTIKDCGVELYHFHRLSERYAAVEFDAFIFLIEDDWRCNFVRLTAEAWPGLVLLFDTNLFDLHLGCLRHTTAPTEIDQLFEHRFAEKPTELPAFGTFHISGSSSDLYRRRYPFRFESGAMSHLYGMFSDSARSELLAEGASSEELLRLQMNQAAEDGQVVSAPIRDKKSKSEYDFCFSGVSLLNDRIAMLLSSFEQLIEEKKRFKAVWALRDEREFELAKTLFLRYRPELANFVDLALMDSACQLESLVESSSLVISLRVDSAASPGVLALEAWTQSKRPLVSELSSFADFLGGKAFFLPAGLGEQEVLLEFLKLTISADSEGSPRLSEELTMPYAATKNRSGEWQSVSTQLSDFLMNRREAIRSALLAVVRKQRENQSQFIENCLSELQSISGELLSEASVSESSELLVFFMKASRSEEL